MNILNVILVLLPVALATQVCYPPYGCFSNDPPFNDKRAMLPEDPAHLLTEFRLYNREHVGMGENIDPAKPNLITSTSFDSSKRTVIYTHGYEGQLGEWWTEPLRNALLEREDLNIIYVEWRRGATFPIRKAAGNARLIGAQIFYLVKEGLMKYAGIDPEDVHCIGYDIGAHVCGFAGKRLARLNRKRLMGRITALDATASSFEDADVDARLDKSDATFVDAIHTDSGNPGFGITHPVGHLDFYPNGGKAQPGCVDDPGQIATCSHYRAIEYFINSLDRNHCPMRGFSCDNYDSFKAGLCNTCPEEGCPVLGYDSEKALTSGPMYMYTTKRKPYCARHYVLQLFTGNKWLAGVSATVLVTLHGSNGETEKFLIPYNKYYAGGMHQVMIPTSYNFKGPVHITLEHGALITSWYLHAAVLKSEGGSDVYVACFRRWLNSADNKVELTSQASADSYCQESI